MTKVSGNELVAGDFYQLKSNGITFFVVEKSPGDLVAIGSGGTKWSISRGLIKDRLRADHVNFVPLGMEKVEDIAPMVFFSSRALRKAPPTPTWDTWIVEEEEVMLVKAIDRVYRADGKPVDGVEGGMMIETFKAVIG